MKLFLVALSFFTRIPIQLKNVTEEEFFKAMTLQPFVGLVIGACLYGLALLFRMIGYAPLGAGLLLLFYLYFTGGLHMDGVADTGDAVFSARDREKMFEIMKDSRLGSYGAVSLMMVLLFDVIGYSYLIEDQTAALILMPVLGRINAVILASLCPPAALGGGLGKGFASAAKPWMGVIYAIIILSLAWVYFSQAVVFASALTLIFDLMLIPYFKRHFGGMTGDHVGLTIELSQAVFMTLVIIMTKLAI